MQPEGLNLAADALMLITLCGYGVATFDSLKKNETHSYKGTHTQVRLHLWEVRYLFQGYDSDSKIF